MNLKENRCLKKCFSCIQVSFTNKPLSKTLYILTDFIVYHKLMFPLFEPYYREIIKDNGMELLLLGDLELHEEC